MTPPANTTARVGSRVKFLCKAEGYPSNISHRWYKDGVDVTLITGRLHSEQAYQYQYATSRIAGTKMELMLPSSQVGYTLNRLINKISEYLN